MLRFSIIFKTSRKVMIEVEDFGIWTTDKPYEIYLNGRMYLKTDRAVQTIAGLKPDTEYEICLKSGEQVSETVTVRTEYEFVTLDVKRFRAVGDGLHDDTASIQAAIMSCPKQGRVYILRGNIK